MEEGGGFEGTRMGSFFYLQVSASSLSIVSKAWKWEVSACRLMLVGIRSFKMNWA